MIFNKTNVKFIHAQNLIKQLYVLPNGFGILAMHGHTIKGGTLDRSVAMALQEYLYSGQKVHMVITGHTHHSVIGDIISKSGALCGANAYSGNDLGFMTRASHNCYIINDDFSYHGMKFDLQNTNNIVGYEIDEELERYNISQKRATTRVIIENLC